MQHHRTLLGALLTLSLLGLAGCQGSDGRTAPDPAPPLRDGSPWEQCGPRQWVVRTSAGDACECLPPYFGPDCGECSEGYEGPDCLSCAEGYVPTDRLGGGFDPNPEDPVDRSFAVAAWEFRCELPPTRACSDLNCGDHGTCDPGDGYASCACEDGYTGPNCAECAPMYQRDAAQACVLGSTCRDTVCGGLGDCVADGSGSFSCDCDSASTDPRCGASDPTMVDASGNAMPWHSLEAGEEAALATVLAPGGAPAYVSVISGPMEASRCDSTCPAGANYRITATSVPPTEGVQFAVLAIGPDPSPPNNPQLEVAVLPPNTYVPITGPVYEELKPIYDNVLWFMKARGIRGAALGLSKGGVTIAENGFGFRDAGLDDDPWDNVGEGPNVVQPNTPFRLASLSKPVTAAAVRAALADRGIAINSTAMGQTAADFIRRSTGVDMVNGLPEFPYSSGPGSSDPNWSQVQVQHLLNHNAGFQRDIAHPPTTVNGVALSDSILPNTTGDGDGGRQTDGQFGSRSFDIAFSSQLYSVAALADGDPTVTADAMLRMLKGVAFDYVPGAVPPAPADGYSNIGYEMLGRVLEGIHNENYDPEDPSGPYGWGPYAGLVQDFLCPFGIAPGEFFPGSGRPRNGEPAYRELSGAAGEQRINAWDIDDPNRLRYVVSGGPRFDACTEADSADCDIFDDADWSDGPNTPVAYGGWATGPLGPAGGWVATVGAYLKFARLHRTNVGTQNQGANGTGSPLAGPGAYIGGTMSSHNGSLPGTWNWVWQLTGSALTYTLPAKFAVWTEDLPATAPTDNNGNILVNESLNFAMPCSPPGDVAAVLFLNQRTDYRAPQGTISAASNSSNAAVYGRVRDFVIGGICQVDSWPTPQMGELLVAQPLSCN